MNITCMIEDHSNPIQPSIKIHNSWCNGNWVELEIGDKRHTVSGEELISAVQRCMIGEKAN